jgi:hypothetical protein
VTSPPDSESRPSGKGPASKSLTTSTVIVAAENVEIPVSEPAADDDVYEAGLIKRSRSTQAEMEARFSAIYSIVEKSQPTGIRFTYYRAVVEGIVPKTDSGYVKVQRAILKMRRDGILPWSWITDSSRWMRKPKSWNSVEDVLADAASSYRKTLWRDAATAVEVWCESESVAGVLLPVTAKWDVPLYPLKGQTSDSFAYSAAMHYRDDPRNLLVIYVGDHDPAGYEIETNLEAKLAEHSGRSDIEFRRLACDATDVERFGLQGTKPKKNSYIDATTGERVPWTGPAVEVEAIDPTVLRQWLDEWISQEIDPEVLRIHQVAEQSERAVLMEIAGLGAGR